MIYKDYFRQKLLEQSFPQQSGNLGPNFGSNIDALAKASGSSKRPNIRAVIDRLRSEVDQISQKQEHELNVNKLDDALDAVQNVHKNQ
jgi:hypothetical protein